MKLFLVLSSVCLTGYHPVAADVLASLRGHGALSSILKFNGLTGETEVQCAGSPKTVKLEKLRDGTCDCSPTVPLKCITPDCSNCEDNTDEKCSDGQIKCLSTGVCLSETAFRDKILHCPWDCIEEVEPVRKECRTQREVEMSHLPPSLPDSCETVHDNERWTIKRLCEKRVPIDCSADDPEKDYFCETLRVAFDRCCDVIGRPKIDIPLRGTGLEFFANDVSANPNLKTDALWKNCSPSKRSDCPKTPF